MKSIKTNIPKYLKKYIVKQDYSSYSYIDHACWRYIMKISINFFTKYADEIYNQGLSDTGITKNKIPKIKSINKKLKKFGWQAVCVRGFIPPQIFMEFQSLKILPIAADMRTHKHLTYTPSPDIVHEAAGHAPIIANKEYSKYLIDYGEVASNAIISNEDMDLYYAIRNLSDIKEKINASKKEIEKYNDELAKAYKNITYTSELSMLSRMNWWTVEYGLVGDLNNPKIYGAGLLSSVSESENCYTKKVKKIKLDLNCTNYPYDITEQQPQLFVTPSYQHLRKVLKKLSKKMSYKIGGEHGIKTAIKAKTVCTVEIDNILQISGIVNNYYQYKNQTIFLKFIGPTQISYNKKQIKGHGVDYHSNGYSTPLGKIKKFNKSINNLNKNEIKKSNLIKKNVTKIHFMNGIKLEGKVENILKRSSKIILITFSNCTVKKDDKILFNPSWGNFDLICGQKITSVFGGPADKQNYYEFLEIEKQYKTKINKSINNNLNSIYKQIDKIRFSKKGHHKLKSIYELVQSKYNDDWLIKYEILELAYKNNNEPWVNHLYNNLKKMSLKNNDSSRALKRGLLLINNHTV